MFDGVALYWEKWKEKAKNDPSWACENPVSFCVSKGENGEIAVSITPDPACFVK